MKICLNCDKKVPPYFRKYCSVFCRRDIRRWAALSYRQYKKRRCEQCYDEPGFGNLHVHHLNENPADNRPDNLVTLCQRCHTSIHQKSKRKRKKKPKNYLGWMINFYNVPGGKLLAEPKGILDHFM